VESVNTLRAVLVAGAVLAAGFAFAAGQWLVMAVLLVAIVAHGLLWVHLARLPQRPPRPRTPIR
jgi:uncharacterized membrane protein YhhN